MFDEKKKAGKVVNTRQEMLSASGLLRRGGAGFSRSLMSVKPDPVAPVSPFGLHFCRSISRSVGFLPPPPAACLLRSHGDGSEWHGLSRHSRAASTTTAKTPVLRERNGKETLSFCPLLGSGGKLILPPPLLFPFVFPGGEHSVGFFDSERRWRDLLTRSVSETTKQTAFSICQRCALQSFFFSFSFCSGLKSPQTVKATGIYFSFIDHIWGIFKKVKAKVKKEKKRKEIYWADTNKVGQEIF